MVGGVLANAMFEGEATGSGLEGLGGPGGMLRLAHFFGGDAVCEIADLIEGKPEVVEAGDDVELLNAGAGSVRGGFDAAAEEAEELAFPSVMGSATVENPPVFAGVMPEAITHGEGDLFFE